MADFLGLMKQAQNMQAKIQAIQSEIESLTVEGVSGGGVVKVTMNGKGLVQSVHIDESLLKPEEREVLEDLVVAAAQDGRKKAEQIVEGKMKDATAGLPLPPGFKLPF